MDKFNKIPKRIRILGVLHRNFILVRIARKLLIALSLKPDRIFRYGKYVDKIKLSSDTSITLSLSDHVDLAIWLYGYYEKIPTLAFKSLVKNGDTVLDVGANIGYYSLLAHDIVGPQGKVYAFEPVSKIFERLIQNTKTLNNIVCLKYACGNTKENTSIYLADDTCTAGSTMTQPQNGNQQRTETIQVIRLDDTINSKVDVIKIDVEGYETNVLKGMGSIIKQNSSIKIFLEMNRHLLKMASSSPEEIFTLMKEHDMTPWKLHLSDNRLKLLPEKEYFGDYNMILFAKPESIPQEYL